MKIPQYMICHGAEFNILNYIPVVRTILKRNLNNLNSVFTVSEFSRKKLIDITSTEVINIGAGADVQDFKRVMVWMIYLNTVTQDGGTYFTNYDKKINAVQGRLVIWPAYWTHTHRGIISEKETKYIATGWFDTQASYVFYPKFIN